MAGLAEVEAQLNRYKATQNELEATMQTIATVARSLEDVGQESEVAKLEEALASCARSMQSVKNQMTALREVKALPQLLEDNFNEAEWYKKRHEELQAESERTGAWRRQERYRELRVQLWNINHRGEPLPEEEGDEELMVVRTQDESFICPITKTDFVQPFKNPACGHTYSREAIMDFVRKFRAAHGGRGSVKCPVAACGSYVQPNELVPDKETERRMTHAKRRKKRATQEPDEEVLDL